MLHKGPTKCICGPSGHEIKNIMCDFVEHPSCVLADDFERRISCFATSHCQFEEKEG